MNLGLAGAAVLKLEVLRLLAPSNAGKTGGGSDLGRRGVVELGLRLRKGSMFAEPSQGMWRPVSWTLELS